MAVLSCMRDLLLTPVWRMREVQRSPPDNGAIADELREMARLLKAQQANPFRVRAYARAADTVAGLDGSVAALYGRDGRPALEALPHVGSGIAGAIEEILRRGTFAQLERLRGQTDPEALFAEIPGIGPQLAAAIHDELHVDTLEQLEAAAHDGRLRQVQGFGPRRVEAIRAVLAERLSRRGGRSIWPAEKPWTATDATTGGSAAGTRVHSRPSVALLLDADREYREKARQEVLPRIAPRRFNPEQKAWLPVLHTERGGWHMTLLFSNTARAHELHRTGDWVVIYYYDGDHHEGQCTVVTEVYGPRAGERVVRGREKEQPR